MVKDQYQAFLLSCNRLHLKSYPAGRCLFKFNNGNNGIKCKKLTIKTPERRCFGVFIVNFEHLTLLLLVFPLFTLSFALYPANIYLFKINNRNTRKRYRWRRSGVIVVNFEHISRFFLAFLLLTLSQKKTLARYPLPNRFI